MFTGGGKFSGCAWVVSMDTCAHGVFAHLLVMDVLLGDVYVSWFCICISISIVCMYARPFLEV